MTTLAFSLVLFSSAEISVEEEFMDCFSAIVISLFFCFCCLLRCHFSLYKVCHTAHHLTDSGGLSMDVDVATYQGQISHYSIATILTITSLFFKEWSTLTFTVGEEDERQGVSNGSHSLLVVNWQWQQKMAICIWRLLQDHVERTCVFHSFSCEKQHHRTQYHFSHSLRQFQQKDRWAFFWPNFWELVRILPSVSVALNQLDKELELPKSQRGTSRVWDNIYCKTLQYFYLYSVTTSVVGALVVWCSF